MPSLFVFLLHRRIRNIRVSGKRYRPDEEDGVVEVEVYVQDN